jgi:transcription elongation GreA/GreB family factor
MSLLNRKVGDEVEFELHGGKHRHRIEKIEAWKIEAPNTPAV